MRHYNFTATLDIERWTISYGRFVLIWNFGFKHVILIRICEVITVFFHILLCYHCAIGVVIVESFPNVNGPSNVECS